MKKINEKGSKATSKRKSQSMKGLSDVSSKKRDKKAADKESKFDEDWVLLMDCEDDAMLEKRYKGI